MKLYTNYRSFVNESSDSTILIAAKEAGKVLVMLNQHVKNTYNEHGKPNMMALIPLIKDVLHNVFVDKANHINYEVLFSILKSESHNKYILGNGNMDLLRDLFDAIDKYESDIILVVEETKHSKDYYCDVVIYNEKTKEGERIISCEGKTNPFTHNKILKIYHK